MRYDLIALTRRTRNIRRRSVVIRDIAPPAILASDLYAATYGRVVALWTAALPGIIAQYERTLSGMTMDSPADTQAQIDAAENGFLRLLLEISPELTRWAMRVERWQAGKWRGAVLSATGVDIGTLIGPEDVRETVQTVIQRNVALVKDVSAQAQSRISDAVFRGLTERRPARDVAADLREAVAMSKRRSVGIASDQLSKITSALADERRREAGIDRWRWRHSGKMHPRALHKARDDKEYTDADAPDDRPGQLPWCGCRAQAVLVFD